MYINLLEFYIYFTLIYSFIILIQNNTEIAKKKIPYLTFFHMLDIVIPCRTATYTNNINIRFPFNYMYIEHTLTPLGFQFLFYIVINCYVEYDTEQSVLSLFELHFI